MIFSKTLKLQQLGRRKLLHVSIAEGEKSYLVPYIREYRSSDAHISVYIRSDIRGYKHRP